MRFPWLSGNADTAWQVTNYSRRFDIGSLLLTHGKTITLLVNPTTKGPQPGSWRVRCFQHGKHLDQVPCYGCMGNVSGRLPPTLSQRLMILLSRSGRRKECSLVRETSDILSREFMGVGQFHDHSRNRGNAKMRACITRVLLL